MKGGIGAGGVAKMSPLKTQNADFNLTATKTVLTHTIVSGEDLRCVGKIDLGDGTKNLDGTGGNFELTVVVDSQFLEPAPQTVVFGTNTRSSMDTHPFVVPSGKTVLLKVKSPNGADTDVDVTARLYSLPG